MSERKIYLKKTGEQKMCINCMQRSVRVLNLVNLDFIRWPRNECDRKKKERKKWWCMEERRDEKNVRVETTPRIIIYLFKV